MLREAMDVHQKRDDPPRRWFSDEFFDLIVWFEPDGSIYGFQLCYDREAAPRALTWIKGKGYSHDGIDTGDFPGGSSKASPILVQDGFFDAETITHRLAEASQNLPLEIRSIVLEKVSRFEKNP
ncbi:MAG: hypothetical protein WCU88_00255 [Elusimicrobiota bacterium]|jgi:hypothetical protein